MGGYDVKSIDNDKNQIGIILIKWFFFPAASECLKGVWEVSGGCLSDTGYLLGGQDVDLIEK